MPTVDLPECRLQYEDLDFTYPWTVAGPPVVFVHGLGASWRMWRPQLPLVAPHRRAVAIDCRGHGGSTAPDADWTIADMAADVRGLLDALEIPRAAIVGLSMGGTIALQFAADYPDRLAELVAVSTFAGFPPEIRQTMSGALDLIRTQPMAETARQRITAAFTDDVDPRLLEHSIAEVSENDPVHYRRAAEATFDFDIRDRLECITAPTTIIFGELDRTTPTALAQELLRIPGSVYREIPAAAHICNLEQPEAFNRYLAEALDLPAAIAVESATG